MEGYLPYLFNRNDESDRHRANALAVEEFMFWNFSECEGVRLC